MRRLSRKTVTLLAVLHAPITARPAFAQQDSSLVEAFVELRVVRGPHSIVDVLVRDSTVLVSLPQFLRLVEIRTTTFEAGRRHMTVVEPGAVRIGFDTDAHQILQGNSTLSLDLAHAVWRNRALYVATGTLAQAFGVRMTVDWDDLIVLVRGTDRLPVVRRLERVRRRALLASLQSPAVPVHSLPVRRMLADGAVLDWAATSSTLDPVGTVSLDLGLGTQFAGGSFNLKYRRQHYAGTHTTQTEFSWSKAWSTGSWLRQLHVGDAFSTGRTPLRLRGVSITNAPFLRAREFANEWFDGSLPDGWELEMYRNGDLVGFAGREDLARYRFPIPVRYGMNPFELIAYGPTGEVRRFRRNYVVPSTRLPSGEFEYSLAGGACTASPCDGIFSVDARYGLSQRITIQGGADFFSRDSLPGLWHPYGLMTAALTGALSITGEVVGNASVGGTLDYIPTPDLEVSLEHVEFTSRTPTPLLGSSQVRRRTRGFLFWRPGKRSHAPFFRVSTIRTDATKLQSNSVRVSSTARLGRTHIDLGAERRSRRAQGLPRSHNTILDATATGVFTGPTDWLRSTFVRGQLAFDVDSGLSRAAVMAARPITPELRVEIETRWDRNPRGFGIELTVVTSLPTVRAVSHNRYSAPDGLRGNQRVEGSIMWNPRDGRIALADGRSLGRAAILGRVFFDEDGNGTWDPTEPGVPNTRLRVGPKGERTDSLGQFMAWDLIPFEPLRIEVDSLSLHNPLWVPAHPVMSATPGPNSFTTVEIPLVRAGELSGRVLLDDGETPVAGIRVDLRAVASRRVMHATSFSDGAFLFYGIRPGQYTLQLSADHLAGLNATAEPISVVVDAGNVTPPDDFVFRLTRRVTSPLPPETDDSARVQPTDRLPNPQPLRERPPTTSGPETAAARRILVQTVHFDFDRVVIRPGPDELALTQKLAILLANPELSIQITGHTDERGTREYNRLLGFRRAASVKRFLTDHGIPATRLMVRSRGEDTPLDPAHTAHAWSLNRRVEFDVLSGGERLRLPSR